MGMPSQNKKGSYAAILIPQGSYKFFAASLPIEELAATCFVTNRDEDPEKGFQRVLDAKRAQEIADYIDGEQAINGEQGTIPTSVILSAQEDAEFAYNSKSKTISFKPVPTAFLVLDGQHRVWGFRLAKTDLRVPVVIYAGLNRQQESKLFIDINTKQRPVPNELLLDIKKLADSETAAEAYSGKIFDLFIKEQTSSLKGQLSPSKRVKGTISRVTFYRALKPILPTIMEHQEKDIFPVLNSYFRALQWWCADKELPDVITSPIAFGAFVLLFPEIASSVADKHEKKYSPDSFKMALTPVFEKTRKGQLKNPGKSAKQLYEALSKCLRGQKLDL